MKLSGEFSQVRSHHWAIQYHLLVHAFAGSVQGTRGGNGGGIHARGGLAIIGRSFFTACSAEGGGGGAAVDGVMINDGGKCRFRSCTANGKQGGGGTCHRDRGSTSRRCPMRGTNGLVVTVGPEYIVIIIALKLCPGRHDARIRKLSAARWTKFFSTLSCQ